LLGAALRRPWLVGLALAGLVLSALLEITHVRAYTAPAATSFCSLGAKLDCTTVALSRFSVFLGLPLPLLGGIGFLAMAIAAWLGSSWLVPLSLGAALASVALLGIELTQIHALCSLCEAVHALSVALAALAWRSRRELAPLGNRDHATLVLLPPLGLALACLGFVPAYYRTVVFKAELPFAEGVTEDLAPWIGARAPKLTLEEYTDYQCPHCRAATAWTLQRLAARPNDVRIVRRQFPMAPCKANQPGSCERLRAAYCAGEAGRFWQMDRWLFAHGDERQIDPARAARDIGVDPSRFASCLERRDIYERAEHESDLAYQRHFTGTPTYVVNGKRIPPETADRWLERGRPD
jgi:uncharacterized membrane protein